MPLDEGGFDLEARAKWDTTVAFEWRARGTAFDDKCVVRIRCDHAARRSIQFPEQWRTALKCDNLAGLVAKSVQKAREECGVAAVECEVLGQPKASPLPPPDATLVPGATVGLLLGGAKIEYLLCAPVRNDAWLCHRGSFVDDKFDPDNPFDEKDLVLKDLTRGAQEADDPPPRKKVRAHLHAGQLCAAVLKWPAAWDQLVAVAAWRAEELRAADQHRPFDQVAAFAGYEASPWKWNAAGRRIQVQVAALWSWRTGSWQRQIVHVRLDNLLHCGVPTHPGLGEADGDLQRRLESVAAAETANGKAPCKYIGLHIGAQRFEPDPSKWPSRHYPASLGKSKATVHFEWLFVSRDGGRTPHRVTMKVQTVLNDKRPVSAHPLKASAPSQLTFSLEFMSALASNVHENIEFKGVAFDGERPQLVLQLPNDGVDVQDEMAHWTLPDGRCVCMNAWQIADLREDQLVAEDSEEAYRAVAQQLGYDCLGKAPDAELAVFRESPGTLQERVWERCPWARPPDETASCWWIANAADQDRTQLVKLVCRSLAVLRLELHASRCATSPKLRQEWERRAENNARAVDVLHNNRHLWRHVGGPDPDTFLRPSDADLVEARAAGEQLRQMIDAHGPTDDGLDVFAEEILCAVSSIKAVAWDAIRRERFSLTPEGLYNELVRNAESLLNKRDAEAARRQARLATIEALDYDDEGELVPAAAGIRPDKYNVNLEEFKCKSSRKPHRWQQAVRMASEVHIDEMRTLLELHYDDVHLERWTERENKRAPVRKGEYKVFASVAHARRKQLNQRLALPKSVKDILRTPEDELRWEKLEQLRRCIMRIVQGEMLVDLDPDELKAVAVAVERSDSTLFADEVGPGSKLPQGTRVQVDVGSESQESRPSQGRGRATELRSRRATVVASIREVEEGSLCVLMRPLWTERAPPMDDMAKAMDSDKTMRRIAKDWPAGAALSIEETLDRMLLVLWDGLFLAQAEAWTSSGVANLSSDETLELARWFLRGQKVGSKPIFDGICAQCGTLLHGTQNQNCALSNKRTAPPSNRDGDLVRHPDGTPKTDAQPPFLLRYSPALFAREAPEMFAHDAETNRLSLRPGVPEPWLRPRHARHEDENTWLYCLDCQERWFPGPGQKAHSHVPFRDKASQCLLKPVTKKGRSKDNTKDKKEDEPEAEPAVDSMMEINEPDIPDVPTVPELPDPPEERPTVEQYQERWDREMARHARAVPGDFCRDNLVPKPIPQLFQDCPHVPFDKLKSNEAQARLSVCRPHSGLEPASCADGVPRYAHNTGDVNFRRRAPRQVASTMGFVLNQRSGKFMGLTPAETDAVHECLTWGRQDGNNKVLAFFGTVLESFRGACQTLMGRFRSVIPEGCYRARIRATRRESREPNEGKLGDTLGEEAHGMVIVDASGHPMKYDALSVFEEVVATQSSRLEIDVPGPDGRGWRRTDSTVDTQQDDTLDETWRRDLAAGAAHLADETWVPANDPHYDAKVWVHMHPHGTGSLLSEPGSGGTQRHSRNRLTLIQSWFRRSALWGFWFLDRLLKTELFFKNKRRRECGRPGASAVDEEDPMKRLFGTAQPADIPESAEWWKRQQRDLFSISDDAELGLMQAMITVTANDSNPEMLAAIRRGPFAAPTEEEFVEYLLTRKRRDQERPAFENHSLEHVLSFQRRVNAIKTSFMNRNKKTPLGRIRDWWDRTEAQMRAALHAHILCWFKLRTKPYEYSPLHPVPRQAPGNEPRQRPREQRVDPLPEGQYQEDNIYHCAEVGRITTEMARPSVAGPAWGGYRDFAKLRIAGLARAVQSRLYLHSCSHKYCLQNRSSCRFFFPWPHQPQQQYDENTERVAGQRRLQDDDQWLNPHNLYLAMFSPSTVHVLPFDPRFGADSARQYAGKYASKPEKWYYLETERDGVKDFLKCRTVGLCMTHNRLLNFHVVRNTRPVQFTPTAFVPEKGSKTPRDPSHLERHPLYPDPQYYLSHTGKYFFRHAALRHLRVEQFNRYFALSDEGSSAAPPTLEDTCADEDDAVPAEPHHRHYDATAEDVPPGATFASAKSVTGARRRQQARLAVSRTPFIEPIGTKREAFYEQKLLLGLPWHCPERPVAVENAGAEWRFVWTPPPPEELGGAVLPERELRLVPDCAASFEQVCADLEKEICKHEHDLVCGCCALVDSVCPACRHAVGFHHCENPYNVRHLRWRKGTLHAGEVDVHRVLFNLHRKGLPMETLRERADEYVAAGLLTVEKGQAIVRVIEQERGVTPMANEPPEGADTRGEAAGAPRARNASRLSPAELAAELKKREDLMRIGAESGAETDQWRVYSYIVGAIAAGEHLRLMVQASAGTGKSFLLTTVFLWCIVNDKKCKAAAPTGIAAANVEIEGTDVAATTLHAMFDLDTEFKTKLDFAKLDHAKVAVLMALQVLLIDEVSMVDVDCYSTIAELLSIVDHSKRPKAHGADTFGNMHIIFFGDFKYPIYTILDCYRCLSHCLACHHYYYFLCTSRQLPPATSKAPFIVFPTVISDFDFRVLRQNRRVVTGDADRADELENFHGVLSDISWGRATERVRDFIIGAYVKGAVCGTAERSELEGSTSVFTKRRFRDRWNRVIVRRLAKTRNHSLKVKARVRARGARGQQWFNERRTQLARKRSRTQALWNLHLAGDWHHDSETKAPPARPHMMRTMLVSNLAVDQRFANGTQGRVLHWFPASVLSKKALPSSHPELLARFAKESALQKSEMYPDMDHMDVTARQETLVNVIGQPVVLQLPLVPCYALTVHKVQALSIKHIVRGCLEGVFAQGQVYVLISRVTDPRNFELLGIPPLDLLEDVAEAWRAAGLDVVDCLRRATEVTCEWVYTPGGGEIRDRLCPKFMSEHTVPVKARKLAEILNPQPRASVVIRKLLDWIDRVDIASQRGDPRPPFATPTGGSIYPEDDDPWWLTELSRRAREEPEPAPGDEDGPAASGEEGPAEDALTEDEDPLSEDGSEAYAVPEPSGSQPTAVPADHVAEVAWSVPSLPLIPEFAMTPAPVLPSSQSASRQSDGETLREGSSSTGAPGSRGGDEFQRAL